MFDEENLFDEEFSTYNTESGEDEIFIDAGYVKRAILPESSLKQRRKQLKIQYSMSLKEYDAMLTRQKNCCAICGVHQRKINRNFDVDHNHNTGQRRELLCNECNFIRVGTVENCINREIDFYDETVAYLKKHSAKMERSTC